MTSGKQSQQHANTQPAQSSQTPSSENTSEQNQQQSSAAASIQTNRRNPKTLNAHDVLQLQRAIGNQAVRRLLHASPGGAQQARTPARRTHEQANAQQSSRTHQTTLQKTALPATAKATKTAYLVIQRELAANRLNVVGENHNESNLRRPQELNYAKQIIGDETGYWREDEFALGDKTDWGDPKHLRIADLLSRIARHFKPLDDATSTLATSQSPITSNQLTTIKQALEVGLNVYFTQLLDEIKVNLSLIKSKKNPLVGQIDQFAPWAQKALELKKKLAQHANQIDQFIKNTAGASDFCLDLWATCYEIHEFGTASINEAFQTNTTITEERSISMHDAANRGADKKGVWKIGQTHVEDIKIVSEEDDRNYKLVDKSEFDSDLA